MCHRRTEKQRKGILNSSLKIRKKVRQIKMAKRGLTLLNPIGLRFEIEIENNQKNLKMERNKAKRTCLLSEANNQFFSVRRQTTFFSFLLFQRP